MGESKTCSAKCTPGVENSSEAGACFASAVDLDQLLVGRLPLVLDLLDGELRGIS